MYLYFKKQICQDNNLLFYIIYSLVFLHALEYILPVEWKLIWIVVLIYSNMVFFHVTLNKLIWTVLALGMLLSCQLCDELLVSNEGQTGGSENSLL